MKHFGFYVVSVMLVLAMGSVQMSASVAAAMLRSNGGVSVNGNPATPVTTVFAGDRIETAPGAVGNLSFNGSSIMVDENSVLVFSGQDLNFTCGGATMKTLRGTGAHYGRYAVKPAKDAARFQVQQVGTTLKVSALEGDLTLNDGTRELNLVAGKSVSMPYNGCVQMAKADPQSFSGINSNPGPNAPPVPDIKPVPVATSDASRIWVPSVAVGGVALAGILAVSQHPLSPSGP